MTHAEVYAPLAVAPIEGVSLEHYAGVSAALIDGFPLNAALENDDLDARAWPRVALRWSQRLARDGVGGQLSAAYQDTLAFARRWLGRRVVPLDDDLAAWLAFLNAWSAHPAPFKLLDELGISPSDVSRIQGAWAQRLEKDEDLRKRAFEIAKNKPSAVPRVRVTRAELKPFPWTRKRAATIEELTAAKPNLSSSFIGDAFGLELYAALHAELGMATKGETAAVLAKQALDETAFAAREARWKKRFTADPTLAQDFRRLVRYYETKLKATGSGEAREPTQVEAPAAVVHAARERTTPAHAAPSTAAEPGPALDGTSLSVEVPRGPALPFIEPDRTAADRGETSLAAAVRDRPELPLTSAPKESNEARAIDGTSLSVEVPRGPALPFAAPLPPEHARAIQPPMLAGTSLAIDVPREPALPFVKGDAPPEIAAELGGTSLDVELPRRPVLPFAAVDEPAPEPNPLAGTALTVEVPRGPALPFVEGDAPEIAASSAMETVARPTTDLGGTSLALDMPRGPALPFAPALDATQPLPDLPAASLEKTTELGERTMDLPDYLRQFMRAAMAAAPAPTRPAAPPLTVQQYASLCVDLSDAPEQATDTLARYRMTAAQRALLDRDFQDRFAREPGLREAWEHACIIYRAWQSALRR